MATAIDIRDAIYATLVELVSQNTSVSTPSDHVGELNADIEHPYPFVGFELFGSLNPRGIGDPARPDGESYDASTAEVTREKVYEMEVRAEIGVLAEERRLRSQLHSDVATWMEQFMEDASALHEDVTDVVGNNFSSAGRADDGVSGLRKTYEIEYERYSSETIPALEQSTLRIKNLESGTTLTEDTVTN